MQFFVGIDIGGTTTTVAIGNSEQTVCYISEQFETESAAGPASVIQDIVARIELMLKDCDVRWSAIAGVTLSTPGPATLDGTLIKTPNLKHENWNQCPIRQRLQDNLPELPADCDVYYLGDGQAAALGEFQIRSRTWFYEPIKLPTMPSKLNSMFMVIVGTGLGGGEVREHSVVRGLAGRAGHAGHLFLPSFAFRYPHDAQLIVGNAASTLESAVSLTSLTHQLEYRLSLPQWSDHPLNQTTEPMKNRAKTLRRYVADGDALAMELFSDQANALGIGLLAINYVGDYDTLIVGGGVCDLAESPRQQYLDMAIAAYQKYCLDGFRNECHIEYSVCGDAGPVIGAVAYAWQCSTP